jgi:hypothetical protein
MLPKIGTDIGGINVALSSTRVAASVIGRRSQTDGLIGAQQVTAAPFAPTEAGKALAGELRAKGLTRPGKVYLRSLRALARSAEEILTMAAQRPKDDGWADIHSKANLLSKELKSLLDAVHALPVLPQARTKNGKIAPRITFIAETYWQEAGYRFVDSTFNAFMTSFQQVEPLEVNELWALPFVLKVQLFEEIVRQSSELTMRAAVSDLKILLKSLRDLIQAPWEEVIESLISFEQVLRTDPSGDYARMDFESRQLYRRQVIRIARYSRLTELEVAHLAVQLACREVPQQTDPRLRQRCAHVGHYLVGEGRHLLVKRSGYRPPWPTRLRMWIREHPSWVYVPAINVLTLLLVSFFGLTAVGVEPTGLLIAWLLLVLPCSQVAVQSVNHLITACFPPEILPKLDFQNGIPSDCCTLVAVPTLLLTERQVRALAESLEIHYLGNIDPNLYFALVTDLPDSSSPPAPKYALVELAADLIRRLNAKYDKSEQSHFLLLHRDQIYSEKEGVWMGWERKRGKLLDLNNFLCGDADPFPIKVGDTQALSRIRFVITLDADTELLRGAAKRLIGTLAHPLHQAIVDPVKNVVTSGYGLLQPRVRISVESSTRSRLAGLYSGQTGLDTYSRAVSDPYQDLFGEGSFAGKGIYEVRVLHRVLYRRFPCNALLSHDLIEGAYARAGLVSDVEVEEDYPSHYNAYIKRKHRWMRGDWQVAGWLRAQVRDETGRLVSNPISFCSRWKIADNLRRSLVEPASFLLFLACWLVLAGSPVHWTLVAVALLFTPTLVRFGGELIGAVLVLRPSRIRIAADALGENALCNLMTLVFLAHQALVSVDAVGRTLLRSVTRRRLLEWETAAQAEADRAKRTAVDRYLDWLPAITLVIGAIITAFRPDALVPALPILLLWGASRPISDWLNRPGRLVERKIDAADRQFLRSAALQTWRYFAEYSMAEHHWLIPDNVQDDGQAAARLSPTNLGLLLNSRQAAREFGYLTTSEFVDLTLRTLQTVAVLPKYRGHLFNWYDTQTLAPLSPRFVSSVDSGNLVASLWTLRQGCLSLLNRPVLQPELIDGIVDLLDCLAESGGCLRAQANNWHFALTQADRTQQGKTLAELAAHLKPSGVARNACDWPANELVRRLHAIQQNWCMLTPWLLAEFAPIGAQLAFNPSLPLSGLPEEIDRSVCELNGVQAVDSMPQTELREQFADLCLKARANAVALINGLNQIAESAADLADRMKFGFLADPRREMLSIGYDLDQEELSPACYELLASETRTATFLTIAQGQLPLASWFRLGRTTVEGQPIVSSWTGTIFEYLMPVLWMRVYPETLLEQTLVGAVRKHQEYCAAAAVPWGMSECAHAQPDPVGNYGYKAFGVPDLAISPNYSEGLVISPYSSFLALAIDPHRSIENLRSMGEAGWLGRFGFYESADYRVGTGSAESRYELVRCWMTHHQGMSMLACLNLLYDGIVQSWFHSDLRVRATEMLLQEKRIR